MEKDNWISVEDKKPPTVTDVLVWAEHWTTGSIPIQAYYFEAHDTWHGSREVRDCMYDGYVNDSKLIFKPTHWQPLPSPPQTIKQ